MIRLKSRDAIIYSAFLVCLIEKCEEEATKLWSTETNVIDVCQKHHDQLMSEAFIS